MIGKNQVDTLHLLVDDIRAVDSSNADKILQNDDNQLSQLSQVRKKPLRSYTYRSKL